MSLLANSTDHCSGLSGLLSSSPSIRRRQLSRAKAIQEGRRFDHQKSRQHRNALYRSKIAQSSSLVSEGTKRTLEVNPQQYGLPRAFIIRLAGEDVLNSGVNNREAYMNEGHTIFFAGFGVDRKPVNLNGSWIAEDHVKMSPDRSTYTIITTDKEENKLEMYLDFTNPGSPTGHVTSFEKEDRSDYLLSLEPYAVYFNVSISMDAGAYFSQAAGTFHWDEGSDNWKNSHWENNGMVFGYDTVAVPSPFGTPIMVNEVSFQDSLDSDHPFQLTKNQYPQGYMCVMDGTKQTDAVWMSFKVNDGAAVPSPSTSRSTQAVKSVYPENAVFKFNDFGDCFVGAYKAAQSDTIYAVRGTAIAPGQLGTEPGILLPPDDLKVAAETEENKLFTSAIKPIPHAFSLAIAASNESISSSQLSVTPLLNLSPMQLAPAGSPTQYYDTVAKTANNDFHDIICYHMDSNIRKTFIQNDSYDLKDPVVKSIANDSIDNAPFYQTLQVPYVVASLGHSTLDEAKYCNANRAEKQLQELPANSPVYKRHSDALYRYRFQEKFGLLQSYLDDQSKNDYSEVMLKVREFLKENLKSRSKDVSDPDALNKALGEIDQLCKWATDSKLYWAFKLYYWCQAVYLPTLIGQLSSGTLSSQVPMKIKALNAVFGMLEGNQINPNGKTFQQAFNEEMRMYQMAFVIPQMVDHEGHAEDFDSILKAMLNEFYENNVNNSDPAIAKQAQIAKALAANQDACQGLFNNLMASMRLAGTLGSWAYIQQVFGNLNEAAGWFQHLVNGAEMAGIFTLLTCAISMCFANIGGSWKDMTPGQRANFITTGAVLLLTFTIKLLKGLISLRTFWGDLAGFYDCFRVFVGAPAVFKALPSAASKVESGLARWFIRTGEEAMAIEGEEMTFWLRLFGRNAGEFLTNFCGAVLAISTIVLCAIDIANTTDPLQMTFDALMIASSSFQLLAIGAGWLMSAGLVTSEAGVALLTTAVSWMGPIALVLAFAGLVVMIVLMCLHKDPPNPVKEFVDKEANNAKLKMEFGTEIDYMNAIPKDANHISLNGITFQADVSHILQLGQTVPEDSRKFVAQTTSKVSHLPDTCWAVKTNSNGVTSIFTYVLDNKGNRMTVYLSESEGGQVFALPMPAKYYTDSTGNSIPVDPAVYLAQLERQTWNVQCVGDVQNESRVVDGKTVTYPQTASFALSRGSKKLFMEAGSKRIRVGSPNGSDMARWKLSLEAIGPPPFTYVKPNWTLTTRSTDEVNLLTYQGDASVPLTWSIKPELPSWLSASQEGIGGGDLRQVAGVQPPEMPARTFVVTGSITIAGQLFQQSTSVTISVMAAPAKQAKEGITSEVLEFAHEQQDEYHNSTEKVNDLRCSLRAYDSGISSNHTFFSWTQSGPIRLDEHYTTQMTLSAIKEHVDSRWYIEGRDFKDLYFPERGAVPPKFTNDRCDYHRAGNAFISQAISNGDANAKPYCNWNATQCAIDEFNSHIWDDNCDRYVNWLTWDKSTQITGNHCSLEEYKAMLTNPDWISEKAAQQASGSWINQSLDMFLHFAKLTALGATNDQLNAVYETLVTRTTPTQPTLDKTGFADITPSTWKTYRGYLTKCQVTYGNLGVSNLNQSRTLYTPGPEPGDGYTNTYYADIDFLFQTEFYQS